MNKNILIDCGGNLGQGFKQLTRDLNIDNTWSVYIFEPNIHCYNRLTSTIKDTNVTILNEAVYTSNVTKKLFGMFTDTYTQGASLHNEFHNSLYYSSNDSTGMDVKCIDLSEFISQFNDCNIYLKLDVEGAEYDILEHLINQNTIKMINKLFVEFHEQYAKTELVKKYNLSERKNLIIKHLIDNNINYTIWH